MDRRAFMTLGGVGMLAGWAPASASEKRRVYVLDQYYLKNGTQAARLHDYLSKSALPALERAGSGPKIVLEGLVAAHMPQIAVIQGFASVDELWSVREKVSADQELAKALEKWEEHPEAPYENFSTALLEATPYSPDPIPPRPATAGGPRIFELRVYHSPTWRQLRALHERFAGPEIRIFHRTGVNPILYTSTLIGPQMPNLTYVIPFDDLAAREKAWNAFGADAEWVKVRQESIDKHGQISQYMQISLYRATPYSPVR